MVFVTDNWLLPVVRDRTRGVWSLDGDTYCRGFDEEAARIDEVEKPVCYRLTVFDGGKKIRFDRIGPGLGRSTWIGDYRN